MYSLIFGNKIFSSHLLPRENTCFFIAYNLGDIIGIGKHFYVRRDSLVFALLQCIAQRIDISFMSHNAPSSLNVSVSLNDVYVNHPHPH